MKPKWQSDALFTEPLKPFEGDCSNVEYGQRLQRQRELKFQRLAEHYGLSADRPGDGWKLAAQLALEHVPGFQVRKSRHKKAKPSATVDDIILLAGAEFGTGSDMSIIRALAKANGWRTDNAAIKTKWRRLRVLRDKNSREYQRLVGFLRGHLPELEARLKELEQKTG